MTDANSDLRAELKDRSSKRISLVHENHSLTDGREWFRPNKALTEHINEVIAEHGPPPAVFKVRRRKNTQHTIKPSDWRG